MSGQNRRAGADTAPEQDHAETVGGDGSEYRPSRTPHLRSAVTEDGVHGSAEPAGPETIELMSDAGVTLKGTRRYKRIIVAAEGYLPLVLYDAEEGGSADQNCRRPSGRCYV